MSLYIDWIDSIYGGFRISWTPNQYKFVKTPFPCIWSNRDMSLFSFWPISPQFCIVKSTKASEKWSHMGEGLGGPLFHALGMVFRLFWGIFVNFVQWEGVFKGLFATFPAFSICQNTFPLQKSGKFNGKVFWQIVIKPKAMGRWFQQRLLLHHIKSNLLVNFSSFWCLWAP